MIVRLLLLCLFAGPAWGQSGPTVQITTPTTASTYVTATSPLMLGGLVQSQGHRRITQVRWVNARGGSGVAQGTTPWTASVPLQGGANQITVTATDDRGRVGQDVLTVTLQTAPPPPGPITVDWTYDGTGGDAFQMERCLVVGSQCPMGAIATVALTLREWVDTAVQATGTYCYRLAVVTHGALGGYSNTLCSP